MSGVPINETQRRIYMSLRNQGKPQITAAAKAGISERSGRRIENNEILPGNKPKRHWRTRQDPFSDIWESEIVPMLIKTPELKPKTLFEYLQGKYPGQYGSSKERTFQRKIKKWKAQYGKGKEVMFLQRQVPGRMGLSDFTTLKKVIISVNGQPLSHILYHFRLAYSGWCHIKVILGGESFSALSEGLQDALWRLGGVPLEHRTDSLSAAFKNMTKEAMEDATNRYATLFSHYNLKATRNNKGKSHENGGIECPHGHMKNRIEQAILLRRSNEFESVKAYQEFLNDIVNRVNHNNQDKITAELPSLQPLPLCKTIDYTEEVVAVSTSSTIRVKRGLYTVPSRLIGEKLRVHLYHDRLELYLGMTHVFSTQRVYASKNKRVRNVDYKHVISSLERKPQAFRYSQLRDDLLPTEAYKTVWKWLDNEMEPRSACKAMVAILALADRANCEEALGSHLLTMKTNSELPVLHKLEKTFDSKQIAIPDVQIHNITGEDYNLLIPIFSQGEGVVP